MENKLEKQPGEVGLRMIDKINSEYYRSLLAQNHRDRASLNGPFSRFLMDNQLGKRLVSFGVFEDPVEKESKRYQEKIRKLSEQFQKVGLESSPGYAVFMAMTQPDLRPQKGDELYLFHYGERIVEDRTQSINPMDIMLQQGQILDLEQTLTAEAGQIATFTKEQIAETVPGVLFDLKFVHLRDLLLDSMEREQWYAILEFLFNSFQDRRINFVLNEILKTLKFAGTIFKNAEFRRVAVNGMVRILAEKGARAFDSFDRFLFDLGLDVSKEKRELLDQQYIWRTLERKWVSSGKGIEYFEMVEKLYELDLLPDNFEKNDQFLIKLYEFVLRELYGNGRHLQAVQKIAESLFNIPRKELSMKEKDSIHTQYVQCCFRLQVSPDLNLASYRRPEE